MIKIVNLSKIYKYRKRRAPALKGIDLELGDKGFVIIKGESGCGKTTLLNCISGLLQFKGCISINDKAYTKQVDYKLRQSDISTVFQDSFLAYNKTAYENIKYASKEKDKEVISKKIGEIASKLGISKLIHRKVSTLSGGQMQRVAIARALINDPKIILADEPTAHLDKKNKEIILDIFRILSKSILVVFVTHETSITSKYGDRIITLDKGKIISDENTNIINDEIKTTISVESNKDVTKDVIKSYESNTSLKSIVFDKLNIKGKNIITLILFPIFLLLSSLFIRPNQGINDYMFSKHYKDEILLSTSENFIFNQNEVAYLNSLKNDIYINPVSVDTITNFELSWDYIIQHRMANSGRDITSYNFSSEIIDINYSKKLIFGRHPNNLNEVVIYNSLVEYLMKIDTNSDYILNILGIDNLENFVGAKLSFFNNYTLEIVGVSESYSNCIYGLKDLINYYAYNKDMADGKRISSDYSYIGNQEIQYNDIFISQDIYETLEEKETYLLNDESYSIKGTFEGDNSAQIIVNKNRLNDLAINNVLLSDTQVNIIPNSKLSELESRFIVSSYYENDKSIYLKNRTNNRIQVFIFFFVSLIITIFILYVNIKSDYLYMYNEIVLKLVLGKSKLSQFGKFLLVEYIKSAIISLPIFIIMSESIKPIFSTTGILLNMLMLDSFSLIMGYLLFFFLIFFVSLFIFRKVLTKSIGNLKVKFNNF